MEQKKALLLALSLHKQSLFPKINVSFQEALPLGTIKLSSKLSHKNQFSSFSKSLTAVSHMDYCSFANACVETSSNSFFSNGANWVVSKNWELTIHAGREFIRKVKSGISLSTVSQTACYNLKLPFRSLQSSPNSLLLL